jgi:ankyrin repeat protein
MYFLNDEERLLYPQTITAYVSTDASPEDIAKALKANADLQNIRKSAVEGQGKRFISEIYYGRRNHELSIDGYSAVHPEEFCCPLSWDRIIDPIVAEDGYTYDRSALTTWFELGHDLKELNQQINSFDKEIGQPYLEGRRQGVQLGKRLVPNVALKSAIDTWVEQHALPFHLACINGDMNRVQNELKNTSNPMLINSTDVLRMTGLEYAAKYDHSEILGYLLTFQNFGGVHQNDDGATYSTAALCRAARKGHVRIVSILLEDHRVDPNHLFDKKTALMHAAMEDRSNVVEIMLNHRSVDANAACEPHKETAFFFACGGDAHKKLGYVSTVQVFLDNQQQAIDFNATCRSEGTALNNAVSMGHLDVVTLLVQDPRIDVNHGSLLHYCKGITPLHTAARGWWVTEEYNRGSMEERIAMLSVLLECPRIDTSVTDKNNETPLMYCVDESNTAYTEIQVALAMKFLEHGTGISKNEVPKWFHINHSAKVRLALFQKVRSVRNEWRQPLLIFHLCRSRNNAESSLVVFRTSWPLLVADLLLQFLTPFEHVVTHYEKTLNDVNQKGLTSLYELCHIRRYGSKNFVLHQTSLIDLRYFLNIGDIDVNTLGPPGGPTGNLFGYGYAAPENTRLSPMKYAENEGHDEEFLSILRNAGGQPLAKELKKITFSIKDQTGREYFFTSNQSTHMYRVYDAYARLAGVPEPLLRGFLESRRFSIDGRSVDSSGMSMTTPFLLGLKDQDQIECTIHT